MNLFFANNIGDTGGGGVLNLTGADNSQFFSAGDNHLSTIAVDIVATKNVQTNGTHSVTFNGDVTAAKIEAFGGSIATFNGVTTQTDEFMSIGGGSKIVINNDVPLEQQQSRHQQQSCGRARRRREVLPDRATCRDSTSSTSTTAPPFGSSPTTPWARAARPTSGAATRPTTLT